MTDAILKHNTRNPDKSVLFLNYGGQTPELTNEKCHFWHFRFDVHGDQKVDALVRQVAVLPPLVGVLRSGGGNGFDAPTLAWAA